MYGKAELRLLLEAFAALDDNDALFCLAEIEYR